MDLTVLAIPMYFGTMGAEAALLQRRALQEGGGGRVDKGYERRDTLTSLAMGVGSLVIAPALNRQARRIRPGKGRGAAGWALLGTAAAAAAATAIGDRLARRTDPRDDSLHAHTEGLTDAAPQETPAWIDALRTIGAPAAVATAGLAATTTWAARTSATRLWDKRVVRDLGTGVLPWAIALVGWDLVYYWNHRFMHESRYMWAIHVVHHSSEHYNLSTALRQPWADVLGTFVPYGLMSLLGVRPELIESSRGINLLYQYWIHTEAISTLGRLERVLNTPSHHRVHHGSNPQYLDKNYGGILITWDRLFGSFEPEDEPVVYGLTKNIETFNPLRVAAHEYLDIAEDVSRSRTWRERLAFVFRGPGWAYRRRRERASAGGV